MHSRPFSAPFGDGAALPQLPQAPRADYALADAIGAQLSQPLGDMEQMVQDLLQTGKISRQQVLALLAAIGEARRVGMQSQQLLRLSQGRLRQSHERIALDSVLRQALSERTVLFQQQGIEMAQRIRPAEVIIDPGLLSSLVDALLDWCTVRGCRLLVSLEVKDWPQHAVLTLNVLETTEASDLSDSPASEKLSWHLLGELARTMEVMVERSISPHQSRLQIEFPRTVGQLEGTGAHEADNGADSILVSEPRTQTGLRALLVSGDAQLTQDVRRVCEQLNLALDCVDSSAAAVRSCEFSAPHLMLVDARAKDARLEVLLGELAHPGGNLPLIEIADDSNTLAMSSWVAGHTTRVGRGALRSQLPQVLALELAKLG